MSSIGRARGRAQGSGSNLLINKKHVLRAGGENFRNRDAGIVPAGFPGKFRIRRRKWSLAKSRAGLYRQGMESKNRIEYSLLRAMVAGLRMLPPSAACSLMERFGRAGGVVLRRRREIVRRQLREVYPAMAPRERDRLAGAVFAHLGRTAGEVFGAGQARLLMATEVDPGWEPLDRALEGGRGAIAVTGHIGNFELGGALLARRYPLLDVVKTQRNPLFDAYVDRKRRAQGIQTVPMRDSAPAVLRHLRQGGLVTLLVDQDAGAAGETVDFLGRPASTWTGAARFSLRTGCPVVPLAMRRTGPGRHVLLIRDALQPPPRSERIEAVQVADYTRRISAAVEQFVREEPRQWFWVHRRWKGAVRGEPK